MIIEKSKWLIILGFLPFFNFTAWIHAAIRTGRNSYYWLAAIYAVPFTAGLVVGMEEDLGLTKQTVERMSDLVGSAAASLWIVGMIHVLLQRHSVDQQIQAYGDCWVQADRVPSNLNPQLHFNRCETPPQLLMECKTCGAQIADSANQCPYCNTTTHGM